MSSTNISYEEAAYHVHQFVDVGIKFQRHTSEKDQDILWRHWSSIVQYAHENNEPTIFKLVMTYNDEQYASSMQERIDGNEDESVEEITRSTPLHIVMELAHRYLSDEYFYYSLPEIIQFLIDAGGSVQCVNEDNNCNVVEMFILEVESMVHTNSISSTNENHVILETLRILLAACVDINWSLSKGYELNLDMLLCFNRVFFQDETEFLIASYTKMSVQKFSLMADICHLIVLKLADKVQSKFTPIRKINWLVFIMNSASAVAYFQTRNASCSDSFNSIMDSLSEMFRCILLHGVDDNLYSSINREWLPAFLFLAKFSTKPNNSQKMIQYLLNGLGERQVKDLEKRLHEIRRYIADGVPVESYLRFQTCIKPDEIRSMITSAQELLSNVERLKSLQHLARQSILRSMSHRCLMGVTTLELPKHLAPFVLLEND